MMRASAPAAPPRMPNFRNSLQQPALDALAALQGHVSFPPDDVRSRTFALLVDDSPFVQGEQRATDGNLQPLHGDPFFPRAGSSSSVSNDQSSGCASASEEEDDLRALDRAFDRALDRALDEEEDLRARRPPASVPKRRGSVPGSVPVNIIRRRETASSSAQPNSLPSPPCFPMFGPEPPPPRQVYQAELCKTPLQFQQEMRGVVTYILGSLEKGGSFLSSDMLVVYLLLCEQLVRDGYQTRDGASCISFDERPGTQTIDGCQIYALHVVGHAAHAIGITQEMIKKPIVKSIACSSAIKALLKLNFLLALLRCFAKFATNDDVSLACTSSTQQINRFKKMLLQQCEGAPWVMAVPETLEGLYDAIVAAVADSAWRDLSDEVCRAFCYPYEQLKWLSVSAKRGKVTNQQSDQCESLEREDNYYRNFFQKHWKSGYVNQAFLKAYSQKLAQIIAAIQNLFGNSTGIIIVGGESFVSPSVTTRPAEVDPRLVSQRLEQRFMGAAPPAYQASGGVAGAPPAHQTSGGVTGAQCYVPRLGNRPPT